MQDAVLHVAFGRHDDQQHAPLGQAQELDVPEACFTPPGRHHDAREVRQLRQERGGRAHELLGPVRGELPFQPMDLALLQRLHHHQAVHEETVALGAWECGRPTYGDWRCTPAPRGRPSRCVWSPATAPGRVASTARASPPAAPRRCSARPGSSADIGRADPASGHFTAHAPGTRPPPRGQTTFSGVATRLPGHPKTRSVAMPPGPSTIGPALAPTAPVL